MHAAGPTHSSVLEKSSSDVCPIVDIPHEDTSNYKDIFLSYFQEPQSNKSVAELRHNLELAGFSVWMDTEDIHSGFDWHSAISDALQNCNALANCCHDDKIPHLRVLQERAVIFHSG